MAVRVLYILFFSSAAWLGVNAWSTPSSSLVTPLTHARRVAVIPYTNPLEATASTTGTESEEDPKKAARKKKLARIREEGGPLAFNTKYGALNPFGIWYGLAAILLGIPWLIGLSILQFLYFITGNRFDPKRKLANLVTQAWGVTLLHLSHSYPEIINRDILKEFYKRKQPAMFVANHNSWLDIPFLGTSVGWRNYKFVSKKELFKVPILGKAISVGGNVMVDRSSRRSQLETLKSGMAILKNGVHLCTFPEGTRSRSGRLMPFKNGAFKMAHKVGAPVIPVSLVASGDVMPPHWMFPRRPARGLAKVVIHEPIESKDKTETELVEEVRKAMISGLPDKQRPLES